MTHDERSELLDEALSVLKDMMVRDGLELAEIGKGMIEYGAMLMEAAPKVTRSDGQSDQAAR